MKTASITLVFVCAVAFTLLREEVEGGGAVPARDVEGGVKEGLRLDKKKAKDLRRNQFSIDPSESKSLISPFAK